MPRRRLLRFILLYFVAPGAYDVEKAEKIIQQSTGAVTFGIKYPEPRPDDIPGTLIIIVLKTGLLLSLTFPGF